MIARLVLVASAILILLSPAPALALNAATIFSASKSSVVLITTTDASGETKSIGSGFYIGDGSRIATNLHVIEGASEVRIKTFDGVTAKIAALSGIDEGLDLAILVSPITRPGLQIADYTPEIGTEIIAIGNPQGLEATLSKGILSGVRANDGKDTYQITAAISPGSSGGPILNETGDVIGVASFFVSGGQSLNFAVPAKYLSQLLLDEEVVPMSSVSDVQVSRKYEYDDILVRLVDVNVDLNDGQRSNDAISPRASGALGYMQEYRVNAKKLSGYVQNLSQREIVNVKISLNYYKDGLMDVEHNRGYEECVVFKYTEQSPQPENALIRSSQMLLDPFSIEKSTVVRPGTAEYFSCALTKWRRGLHVVPKILDYEYKR